jgi:hypothetical protein
MTSPSSAAAFEALAVVVRDRGIDIGDDPGRLRGMLNDVLAADARVNRAAIDALVLGAEAGLHRALSTTPAPDEARLTAELMARGVSAELSGQTVRAWITAAQGGRTAPAPPEPTMVPPTALPASPAMVPPTALPASPPPLAATVAPRAGATVLPGETNTFESTTPTETGAAIGAAAEMPTAGLPALDAVIVPPPPPVPPGDGSGSGALPRRTLLVLVTAVVAVVALVVGFLALGGGDDADDAASTTTVPTSSSVAPTTTAVGEPLLEVLSPASGTETATSDTTLTGRADPGSAVTVDGTAVTVGADGAWTHTVTLTQAETTFTIVVTTPTGGTKTVAWVVKRDATAPPLEIVEPADGTVVNNPVVRLRGTTEVGASVLVDGVGAASDPDTTTGAVLGWLSDVTIVGGQQTFTVTSTDLAGNVATKTVTLRFQSTAPSTTRRPPPPPPPPSTTTTPPPPPSTLVAVNDDGGTYNFSPGSYFSFNVVGNDSGDWTHIEYGGLSGGYGTLTKLSGGFFQYTMRDNGNWTETFQYRLRNSATGEVSNWATVTIHILCSC